MSGVGFFFFLDKVVKLVRGGSVINGAYPVKFKHGLYVVYAGGGATSAWRSWGLATSGTLSTMPVSMTPNRSLVLPCPIL